MPRLKPITSKEQVPPEYRPVADAVVTVSYTHLTLPTILRV